MPELSFRVYFDGQPAPLEDLAAIESLSVEQTEGAAWEARIVMTLGLDEQGNWTGSRPYSLRPQTQVRVELRLGNRGYQALIDGPIVSVDSAMDSRPGRSVVTIVAHDDSAWLNRESGPVATEDMTVSQVSEMLFLRNSSAHITSTQIEFPDEVTPSLGDAFAEQGTAMQILRKIATQNGVRAYVLPGGTPGASIGVMREDPQPPAELPALVLLGSGRNLSDVVISEDPETAQNVVAHNLRLSDRQVTSYTTSLSDETLLANDPAAPDMPPRHLHPALNDSEDATHRSIAQARRRNNAIKINGTLIAAAYDTILTPYQLATLRLGGSRNSTVMRITNVKHLITPHAYQVEFEGRSNAFSAVAGGLGLPTGIF